MMAQNEQTTEQRSTLEPCYGVCGTLQEERVCLVPVRDTDKFRQRLVAAWAEFQHSVVYDAID